MFRRVKTILLPPIDSQNARNKTTLCHKSHKLLSKALTKRTIFNADSANWFNGRKNINERTDLRTKVVRKEVCFRVASSQPLTSRFSWGIWLALFLSKKCLKYRTASKELWIAFESRPEWGEAVDYRNMTCNFPCFAPIWHKIIILNVSQLNSIKYMESFLYIM